MPATLNETNNTPLKRVDVDLVTLDIIENAMSNARKEMDAVLMRTAMSPGIREQGDAFPMIANHEGKMVVGQFGSFISGFVNSYNGDINEGDVFLTNDPYACDGAVSHLPDWLILVPVFKDGRLINWAAMFGHMSDVGGKVPGSLPTDATSIFEEGIRIPPMKIYRGGVLNEDALDIILHNVRVPSWDQSDFNAIVAACRTAARRCIELAERFGDDIFTSALGEMLERNYVAMREIIRNVVPESKRSFEDYICDDGAGLGPYTMRCTLWREGDKAIFDFEGTDPQAPSSVNFLPQRGDVQDVLRGLHHQPVRSLDPVQRWLLRPGGGAHPPGLHPQAQLSCGAVVPDPPAGAAVRCDERTAGPGFAGCHERGRLLGLTALHVLGLRRQRGMVPAVPDRLRGYSRAPAR